MTDTRPIAPPSRRHPVLTVLMIVGGVILLLPGLCSILYAGAFAIDAPRDFQTYLPIVLMILVPTVLLAWPGIMLLRRALRRPAPGAPP